MHQVDDATVTATSAEFVESFLHASRFASVGSTAVATRTPAGWDELSYADLDERSMRVRTWLCCRGIRAGDRVGLIGDSSGDWVAAFFGVLRAGGVVVPLDPGLTAAELESVAVRAPLSAVIVSSALRATVESAPAVTHVPALALEDIKTAAAPMGRDAVRRRNDIALLVWTSGTTGSPKGVCLTFGNLDYVVSQSVAEQEATADDSWLSILSLNHMLELSCGLLACLRTGASIAFPGSRMPHEIVAAMRERGVTRMMVVPMLLRLLQPAFARNPEAAKRLRSLFSGGAPLGVELLRSYADAEIPAYEGYGLTELSPAVSMNSARRNRPGSVGRPLPGTDVRIDSGEILVRSPGLMAGYWGDEKSTRAVIDADGWFHTGDLGHLDADGYLFVTGRAKNLVVLESGKKVSPEEVEAALVLSSMFAEVCVVGLPLELEGHHEAVCAVVVPTADARARHGGTAALVEAAEEEVRRCSRELSGYKRPTVVSVHDGPLPKTVKFSLRRADVLAAVITSRKNR